MKYLDDYYLKCNNRLIELSHGEGKWYSKRAYYYYNHYLVSRKKDDDAYFKAKQIYDKELANTQMFVDKYRRNHIDIYRYCDQTYSKNPLIKNANVDWNSYITACMLIASEYKDSILQSEYEGQCRSCYIGAMFDFVKIVIKTKFKNAEYQYLHYFQSNQLYSIPKEINNTFRSKENQILLKQAYDYLLEIERTYKKNYLNVNDEDITVNPADAYYRTGHVKLIMGVTFLFYNQVEKANNCFEECISYENKAENAAAEMRKRKIDKFVWYTRKPLIASLLYLHRYNDAKSVYDKIPNYSITEVHKRSCAKLFCE